MSDQILDGISDINEDLIKDRSKIDQVLVNQQTIIAKLDRLYERLPRTEEKIKIAVADGLAETIHQAKTKKGLLEIIGKYLKKRGEK